MTAVEATECDLTGDGGAGGELAFVSPSTCRGIRPNVILIFFLSQNTCRG